MSLRDLPKSLIDSVVEIATESQHKHEKQTSKLIEQGLKRFGVKAVDDLTENDQKALHAWVQIQLTESSCGCESDMTEDDMPGDSVYHKDGDEDAEKKKELDEDDKEDSLKESIALRADEIATNGAVGVTDPENQLPVHADVLKDTSVDGKHEFRLFVQFNTNTLPVIVPPVTLPGAPTVDALRDVVEGLPFFCDVCEKALVDASANIASVSEARQAGGATVQFVGFFFAKSGDEEKKIKDGTTLIVKSAKDLATAVNIPLNDLFRTNDDEKTFNDAIAKSSKVYCFMDPYAFEMSGDRTLGFGKTEKAALKDYQDSADDV